MAKFSAELEGLRRAGLKNFEFLSDMFISLLALVMPCTGELSFLNLKKGMVVQSSSQISDRQRGGSTKVH